MVTRGLDLLTMGVWVTPLASQLTSRGDNRESGESRMVADKEMILHCGFETTCSGRAVVLFHSPLSVSLGKQTKQNPARAGPRIYYTTHMNLSGMKAGGRCCNVPLRSPLHIWGRHLPNHWERYHVKNCLSWLVLPGPKSHTPVLSSLFLMPGQWGWGYRQTLLPPGK